MFNKRKPMMRPRMGSNNKKAGYSMYPRYCPCYWWYYHDYDYDYDYYDDYYYDDWYTDDSDYLYYDDEVYTASIAKKAFRAGVKQGMKQAKMMWDKKEPEPTPPEPPMTEKKGE